MAKEIQIICKNIFKTDTKAETSKEYTKRWIELINQREKNKSRTTASY
ncbi:MAG: hypothetical protein KH268_12140 [Clostridiales bacterium]|nr:hypothetical protein [Clostridiales bacterium]